MTLQALTTHIMSIMHAWGSLKVGSRTWTNSTLRLCVPERLKSINLHKLVRPGLIQPRVQIHGGLEGVTFMLLHW